MGRVANAFLGGWSLSGLSHWTTGLPFNIFVTGWSTNYNLAGEAIQVASPGKVGVYRDAAGNPNTFKDPIAVQQMLSDTRIREKVGNAMNCVVRATSESIQASENSGRLPSNKS
jgi:hypothetical protein